MERWRNQVAIVTGASSGIGAALVEQLVESGVIVVGVPRRVERVEALVQNLIDKPGKLYPIKADVSLEDDIMQTFNWVEANLGPVSILVNNAAVSLDASCTEGDTELWKKILDTNVLGVSIATREAVKRMRKNNVDGHIIHINSIAGHKIVSNLPPMYTASKFAITALTEALRQELNSLDSKIKISSISPGYTNTELFSKEVAKNKELGKAIAAAPSLNSVDIANAAMYILATPPHVQVHDLIIKVVGEPF